MRHDQHLAARRKFGYQLLIPPVGHPLQRVRQGLGVRQSGDARILRIVGRMLGVVCRKSRGTNGITAAPLEHLLIAMPECGFFLVETLQRAVMALVQSPVRLDRKMHQVHLFKDQPKRSGRPLEQRGHGKIKPVTFCQQRLSGIAGFAQTPFG